MLSKISWSEFFWFLFLAVISYYLYVFLFYFRNDLAALFRTQKNKDNRFMEPSAFPDKGTVSNGEIPFSLIHELLEDLKKLFMHAAHMGTGKPELIQAIHSMVKSYPNISGTGLKEDISEHIVQEVKQICDIDLETGDLLPIWAP